MALSTSVKVSFWALLVTLATCVMAEEIQSKDSGLTAMGEGTHDLSSRAKRWFFAIKAGFTSEDKLEILQRHNTLRGQQKAANMLRMEWDSDLESLAKKWSNQCVWRHSSEEHRSNVGRFKYVGENMYMALQTANPIKPSLAVDTWYEEVKNYDFDKSSCKPGRMCSHYTQVVWASTRSLGCALKFCKRIGNSSLIHAYLITCNYGPAGNLKSERPFKKGAVCSQCPATRPYCSSDLCSVVSSKVKHSLRTARP